MADQKLFIDINKRPMMWFLVIPLSVEFLLMAMYYSGSEPLQNIIVPQISNDKYLNREFGLLENLQNLVLCVSLIFSVYYLLKKSSTWKGLNLLICMGLTFLFLEEIDYGWHIREWFFGLPADLEEGYFKNVHNSNGGMPREIIQILANTTLAVLFIALPLLKGKMPFRKIELIPRAWFSTCALGLLVTTGIAYLLKWLNPGIPDLLFNNTGEFTELWYYYIAFLYLVHLRDEYLLNQ